MHVHNFVVQVIAAYMMCTQTYFYIHKQMFMETVSFSPVNIFKLNFNFLPVIPSSFQAHDLLLNKRSLATVI